MYKTMCSLTGKARELKKNCDMNYYTTDISPQKHFSKLSSFLTEMCLYAD